jgi:DNA-binding NarL/FixJ family response regulator
MLPTLVESTLTDAIVDLGDVEAGTAVLHRYVTAPLPPFLRTNFLLHSRGALYAAAGDHKSALADLLECARRLEYWDAVDHPHLTWRRRAALAHAALGDHQQAVVLAEEDLKVARKRELPRSLGIALRVAGTLHKNEYGTGLLAEAVTVLGNTKAVLEHARAQAELGLRLCGGSRRTEAATLLHEALATAESCAAAPLATMVRAALDSTDEDLGHGASTLTRREQGIALLAAQGRSNPEIAEALVLTRRTVEFHLTNVYRKLGISRRSQLSTVLSGRGR